MRLVLALLFGSTLGALGGAVIAGLLGALEALNIADISARAVFWAQFTRALPIICAVTLVASVIIGLPIHIAAQRLRITAAPAYFAIGAAAAAILIVAAALLTLGDWTFVDEALQDAVQYAIVGIPTGGLTALFAWLIRRPDRDAPPNPPTSAP